MRSLLRRQALESFQRRLEPSHSEAVEASEMLVLGESLILAPASRTNRRFASRLAAVLRECAAETLHLKAAVSLLIINEASQPCLVARTEYPALQY